ncbi:extracellular solute-binding protein [Paenibacillus daejeonensis]|uniref:extracellular solute-binding protein n=1 Tax=Paenibacillus daejeonensis TaxID=135193 RepID=UPI00037AC2E3|nr:extracellular solute-binding protein [Paenibacillus daejeonensis]
MKPTRKWLTPVLSVALSAALLAGCSGGNNGPAASPGNGEAPSNGEQTGGGFELGAQPLSFTMYGHYDWYTMPPWGGDEASAWIKENKKVDIQAIHSGGSASQKLNTMIATGDLPDAIWLERSQVERLRGAGLLAPLDEYLDKYPNLKEWLGEENINLLRSEDGHLYQIPNWYTQQPNGNGGYVVNRKIYKELGEPKLETTDDLYEYLKQVRDNYPNVVPFEPYLGKDGQGLDVLMTAFREDDQKYTGLRAVPKGDQLTSIFEDDIFIEGQQYVSKLFREKLITQDALTQTVDQVTEKVMTGRVAVYASASATDTPQDAHNELIKDDPDAGYFMIWPIHKEGLDKDKIFPGTYTSLGWNVTVITKAAENPEAIFAYYDWLTGPEGQSTIMWGPAGKFWDGMEEDGRTPKFTEAYVTEAAELTQLQTSTSNLNWAGNTVYVDRTKAAFEENLPVEQQNWATRWQREITWKTQKDATEFINIDPQPDSEEGIIRQRVEDIFTEMRAKVLYAKSDEEVIAIIEKAGQDADAAGYDKLLAYRTQKWQENLAAMKG